MMVQGPATGQTVEHSRSTKAGQRHKATGQPTGRTQVEQDDSRADEQEQRCIESRSLEALKCLGCQSHKKTTHHRGLSKASISAATGCTFTGQTVIPHANFM